MRHYQDTNDIRTTHFPLTIHIHSRIQIQVATITRLSVALSNSAT